MNRVEAAIDQLYDITDTPPISPIVYPELIIDDILSHSADDEYDISIRRKVVIFLLRLVEAPENLRGIGLMSHYAIHLVMPFMKLAKLSASDQDKIEKVISNWFVTLYGLTDKRNYYKDVSGNESQLFRFHLEASDQKNPRRYASRIHRQASRVPSPLYCHYGYFIHLKIRDFMRKALMTKNPEEKIYERICSARMFFNFIHPSIKYSTEHPSKIPEYYIDSFAEEYDRGAFVRLSTARKTRGRTYLELSDRAANYRGWFLELLNNDYIPGNRDICDTDEYRLNDYEPGISLDEDVELYGKKSADDFPDDLRTITHYVSYPLEPGVDDNTYGIEAPFEEDPFCVAKEKKFEIVKKKPYLRRAWMDFINLRKYNFFWDSSFLNLYMYSIIYKVIGSLFNTKLQSADNICCAYLMTLMHTGINNVYLLETQIKIKETRQLLPQVSLENGNYELIVDLPIPERRAGDSSGCLRTYKQVNIPIFSFLKPFIENIYSADKKYLFSLIDEDDNERRIDKTVLKTFLKKKINTPFGLKLSVEAISNSFFSLYCSRFGMDPIVACYISKNHQGLFNAPLHYVFLPQKHFYQEYQETSNKVHKAIEENLKLMRGGNNLATHVNLKPSDVLKKSVNESGYGSSQIPRSSTWFSLIHDLKSRIKSYGLDKLHQRHNLYSIYLYIVLMLSTSLRPRNNPEIAWGDYHPELGVIMLSDKLSPKYYEERVVPIVRKTGKLIENLRTKFPKFKALVDDYHAPGFSRFEPTRLFFFLDKEFNIVEFRLMEIKRILTEDYISFPFPLNTPRHYIRSKCYWENVYYELAAMFMGHQTAGKEWLTEFSSVDFSETVSTFENVVEKVLDELDIEVIPYLPILR